MASKMSLDHVEDIGNKNDNVIRLGFGIFFSINDKIGLVIGDFELLF